MTNESKFKKLRKAIVERIHDINDEETLCLVAAHVLNETDSCGYCPAKEYCSYHATGWNYHSCPNNLKNWINLQEEEKDE